MVSDKNSYRIFIYNPDGRYREHTVPNVWDGFRLAEVFNIVNNYIDSDDFKNGTHNRIVVTDQNDYCHFDYKVGEGVVFPTPESYVMSRTLAHICTE